MCVKWCTKLFNQLALRSLMENGINWRSRRGELPAVALLPLAQDIIRQEGKFIMQRARQYSRAQPSQRESAGSVINLLGELARAPQGPNTYICAKQVSNFANKLLFLLGQSSRHQQQCT